MEIGLVWSIGVIAEIIFFINQKKILSRFGNLTYVWFSCFIFTVVRFLIIFFSDGLLILLIFAQLLHAITFGLHHVTSIMLVTNLFPDSAKAIGQSSYTVASYGIGGSLGGVFSGLIWEEFFPESIYIFASLVAFLGAVVAWLLIRTYKVECDSK
jgi:PPP family 3-phenylpropionic acid transporter